MEFIPELIISSISFKTSSMPNLNTPGIDLISSLPLKFSLINTGCIKSLEERLVSDTRSIRFEFFLSLRRRVLGYFLLINILISDCS